MKKHRPIQFLAIAFTFLFLLQVGAQEEQELLSLTVTTGPVTIYNADGTTEELAAGQTVLVSPDDLVGVGEGGEAEVTVAGATVTLGSNARLQAGDTSDTVVINDVPVVLSPGARVRATFVDEVPFFEVLAGSVDLIGPTEENPDVPSTIMVVGPIGGTAISVSEGSVSVADTDGKVTPLGGGAAGSMINPQGVYTIQIEPGTVFTVSEPLELLKGELAPPLSPPGGGVPPGAPVPSTALGKFPLGTTTPQVPLLVGAPPFSSGLP